MSRLRWAPFCLSLSDRYVQSHSTPKLIRASYKLPFSKSHFSPQNSACSLVRLLWNPPPDPRSSPCPPGNLVLKVRFRLSLSDTQFEQHKTFHIHLYALYRKRWKGQWCYISLSDPHSIPSDNPASSWWTRQLQIGYVDCRRILR